MNVEIRRMHGGKFVRTSSLRRLMNDFAQYLELPEDTTVSLLITNDAMLCRLNRDFRGKDRPTDVLSFSLREGTLPASDHLGDIVVSVNRAQLQAMEKGWRIQQEIAFLLLHGLLHLLGYDHETDEDAEAMDAVAAKIWNQACSSVESLESRSRKPTTTQNPTNYE